MAGSPNRSLPGEFQALNLLATPVGRKILFTALYMSEGAPIGFLWWALPTLLRSDNLPIEQITALTSLLTLPWALKFIWAPLIDVLRRRWPLRRWIVSSQALMGFTIFPLFFLDLHDDFLTISLFLVAHSFAAATQDVSIDALCIRVTGLRERGSLNGWMQAGMLTSRAILGGGALVMMTSIGLNAVLTLLIAVVWSSSVLLLLTKESDTPADEKPEGALPFRKILLLTLARRSTWYGLLFAAIAGAGYEAVGAVAGPFLIDQGLTSEKVGWFFLLPAVVAMIAGSVTGGYVADRLNRRAAVALFLMTMAGSVFLFSAFGFSEIASSDWYLITLSVLYFSIGLFVSSTYALFMDITHPSLGATQFSTYMGATNLCESWSSFAVGRIAGGWGYPVAFLIMGLVSLSTLPLLRKLETGPAVGGSLEPAQ